MDRRSYLKHSLGLGGMLMLPPGVLALAGCSRQAADGADELATIAGGTMGTSYRVRLPAAAGTGLEQAIAASLADTDARMSTYKASSELMVFNNSHSTDWQPLSPETFNVVSTAMDVGVSSHGAFDATVGPLVNLWGFGASGSASGRPAARDINELLASTGLDLLDLDRDNARLRKLKADTALDLSGVAKGYGVDQVAAVLDAAGISHYLIEVGGELRSRGQKPDGNSWRVAIERPDPARRDVFRVINLDNAAIATSGDYRNFFQDGGQRYSHTIDPRNGQPVHHQLASVSVIAETTMQADALSTAMMVMGPEDAEHFARENGIAAHFILKSGKSLEEHWTPAFATRLEA